MTINRKGSTGAEPEKPRVKTETLQSLIRDAKKLIELNDEHGLFEARNSSDRLDLMIYEELLERRQNDFCPIRCPL